MKLFDFDGTLVDSNGVWERIDLDFLGRHGLEPTEEYAHTVGHSIFPLAAQYTRDYYRLDMSAQAIMDEWLSLAWDEYAHRVPFKPGAEDFLRACRGRGEPMALVTACAPRLCRAALARLGLEGWFRDLIFVEELGLTKREPEAFPQILALLGAQAGACTLYEDSPGACAAAKEAGLTVVGVYDRFYAAYEDELRRVCDRFILDFTELL